MGMIKENVSQLRFAENVFENTKENVEWDEYYYFC